jgi:hypothetical protein
MPLIFYVIISISKDLWIVKKWINWINTFRCHGMPQHPAYVTVPQHMLLIYYRLLYLSLSLLVTISLNVFLLLCHSRNVLHASSIAKTYTSVNTFTILPVSFSPWCVLLWKYLQNNVSKLRTMYTCTNITGIPWLP